MQAAALFAILYGITTETGKRRCPCTTPWKPCMCSGSGGKENGPKLLQIDYYDVKEDCVASMVVANFVYFGCGLHILQYHPSRPLTKASLQSWVQYERIMENAVLAYRASGSARGGYLGEAFMSTHSILIEKIEDPMLEEILAYARGDDMLLSQCYEKVDELKNSMEEFVSDIPPEDICARGYFADECVVALNKRGKAVMTRLGVSIVPAYESTLNQHWATRERDGRHYVPLIPHELANFLGIINMALREEKLSSEN